jgi:hypothetical protein
MRKYNCEALWYRREGKQLNFHISRHIAHLGWETKATHAQARYTCPSIEFFQIWCSYVLSAEPTTNMPSDETLFWLVTWAPPCLPPFGYCQKFIHRVRKTYLYLPNACKIPTQTVTLTPAYLHIYICRYAGQARTAVFPWSPNFQFTLDITSDSYRETNNTHLL